METDFTKFEFSQLLDAMSLMHKVAPDYEDTEEYREGWHKVHSRLSKEINLRMGEHL